MDDADDDDPPLEKLKGLGLPAYAARAYLALLSLGTAEARAVRQLAGIPAAKVYGSLDQLHRRGLVEVLPGRPRKYAPVPMGEFLDRELEAQRERLAEAERRREELTALFPILGGGRLEEVGQTSTLRGGRNISDQFRRNAAACRRELQLLPPAPPAQRLRALPRHLGAARDRGATITLILPSHSPPEAILWQCGGLHHEGRVDVGATHDPAVALATFDSGSAILARFGPPESPDRRGDVAIYTTERALVGEIVALLRTSWDHAGALPPPGTAGDAAPGGLDIPVQAKESARAPPVQR